MGGGGGTKTPIGLELKEKDMAHWAGRGKRKLGVCVGDPPPPYPARIVYRRQSRDEVRSVL